jgi:plasmid stability protein
VAQLIVRKLSDHLVRLLKRRAAEHGRSAEQEHRAILEQALQNTRRGSFKDRLLEMPDVGEDLDFERQDDLGRKGPF